MEKNRKKSMILKRCIPADGQSYEITLKDDECFVLSDSRNDMDDSRNSSFTKVTKKNIIGKVILPA
ncbi:MAG: S26 family signal peptidase [Eubacterium sp.]